MKKIIFFISLTLFLISLTLTPYTTAQSSDGIGIFVLIMGFFALVCDWQSGIVWFANPLLLVAWILLFINVRVSKIFSIASCICALYFLLIDKVVANEAGGKSVIISYEIGYWFWLGSCLIFCIGVCIYAKEAVNAPN